MRGMMVFFVGGMLAASSALAQWKPEKPVEIIIGTSAGGPQDRAGRLIQKILQEQRLVTAPINVLNRPGGGGVIGLTYLGQQPGDAHYVMVNSITLFTNHITGRTQLSYSDFTPLAVIGAEFVAVAVLADSPLKSARDLAERLRSDPGALSVSIGTAFGNATHISHALAMKAAGVDIRKMKTVVFNSGGDAMTALLGGHVDAMASAPSTLRQHVKSGKVRLLATVAPQRLAGDFAAVPTWKELGTDVTFELWRGLAGPRNLGAAQVRFWDDALGRMVKTAEWKEQLALSGMEDVYRNSAQTAAYWKAQDGQVRAVLTELGLAK